MNYFGIISSDIDTENDTSHNNNKLINLLQVQPNNWNIL